MVCALIMLTVGADALAAAEGKHSIPRANVRIATTAGVKP
jgi:hypothetical protein